VRWLGILTVVGGVSHALGAATILEEVEFRPEPTPVVRLRFSAPVDGVARALGANASSPARVYVDFDGTRLGRTASRNVSGHGALLDVRTSQRTATTTRVVLDLSQPLAVSVEPDGHVVTLALRETSPTEPPPVARPPITIEPPAAVAPIETATPRRREVVPAPSPPPAAPPAPPIPRTEQPTGFVGFGAGAEAFPADSSVPIPDRWRVGWPRYDRYPAAETPYVRGEWWDPYDLNVLKGDYPIIGQHTFFAFTARSDTVLEGRRLPTSSDVSAARPDSEGFFGRGEQLLFEQNFLLSFELFHGNAAFKPRDWELRATPVFNLNYLRAEENGVVNIDPGRGTDRFDGHLAFEELFGDLKLADVSPFYDTVNLRTGIQGFTSDFRGFIFTDFSPGVRLSGNWAANRTQWNLAYFRQLEKDTNSGLNSLFSDREQDVVVANVTRQDFIWPGYSAQLSVHYTGDYASRHYDENGFLVRPANIGDSAPHDVRAGYFGWTGDGHIQRVGVSHAFFQAVGRDAHNPIARRGQDINAQMAALELSYDRDWLRFESSFFWASGDGNPEDGTARGFDAIFDNPRFVGGPFSFWQRQGIKLTGTNVNLVNRFSLLPNLRSSKDEGQENFVNPGIFIFNVGVFGRLTPKLSFEANVNYLRFQETAVPQLVLLQRDIGNDIGVDYSLGLRYRPLLIDNVVLVLGVGALTPLDGFHDIFGSRTLYQAFGAATLTY
jgi:hypothetical protein